MGIWDEIINTTDQLADLTKDEKRKPCPDYGAVCPRCGAVQLLYDGKLNLTCPACGYESSAGFS